MKHIALAVLLLTGCAKIEGEWEVTDYKVHACFNGICNTAKLPGPYMGCDTSVKGYATFNDGNAVIDVAVNAKCKGRPEFYEHWVVYSGDYEAKDGMLVLTKMGEAVKFIISFGGPDTLTLKHSYNLHNSTITTEINLRRFKEQK